MDNKFYCESCKETVETELIMKNNKFTIKGNELIIKGNKRICKTCQSILYDFDLDNEISKLAIKMYTELFGVKGEEITELRKYYDISQETLGKVLGIAKKTINSYETNNSIPNEIYQTVLKRIIQEPSELVRYAEINKEKLSNFEKRKIFDNNIYKIKQSNFESLVVRETSEFTGYNKTNPEKIKNIILFFTKKGIGKTKLGKALFLVDALSYSLNLESITGLEYIKAQHGPIPKTFGYMIEALVIEDIILEEIIEKEDDVRYIYYSKEEINTDILSEDLDILEQVYKYVESNSASKISAFTHTLKVYSETKEKELISFDYLDSFKLE